MITDIYIVYNDPSIEDRIMKADVDRSYFYHFIDIGSKYGKSKGFKLKGAWGARLNPFIAIFDKDKMIKGIYREASKDPVKDLIDYLNGNVD